MKAAVSFEAEPREKSGKGIARALRRAGKVPATIYSEGNAAVSISLDANNLSKEYFHGGFFSKIVEIKAGKDQFFALPKDVQLHPVKDTLMHADFYQVTEKSTINVFVPVHVKGREQSPGLKRGGSLNMVRHDLELVCSVNNIPDHIEIDVSKLSIGDSVHISHIELPEGVKPAIDDRDFTILTLAGRLKKEEETATTEVAANEVPTDGDAKAQESEGDSE